MRKLILTVLSQFIIIFVFGIFQNSCKSTHSDSETIHKIKSTVEKLNSNLPLKDNLNDIIYEKVFFDDNTLTYIYQVPDLDYSNAENIKNNILIGQRAAAKDSPEKAAFYNDIIKVNAKIIYNYHTANGESMIIQINSDELNNAINDNKKEVSFEFSELLKNAENGNDIAQCELGVKYYKGEDVKQNYKEAIKWFQKSADQGNSHAQFNLGNVYRLGKGVDIDYDKAFYWYLKSAEQGNSGAQFNLGCLYRLGDGVKQNYNTAYKWFLKAAKQNHADAQNNLGVMFQNGYGVKIDYQEALDWYRKASENGNKDAQTNLAYMHYMGYGVLKDESKAINLLKDAALEGNENAKQILFQLGY